MDVALFIAHLSSFSVIIPLVLAIIQWKKLPADISILRWLLVTSLITDIVSFILSQVLSIRNHVVGDIYMFIQFSLLLYIFSLQFDRKAILKIAYIALIGFYLIGLFFLENYTASTVNSNAAASLIIIVVSILFFYKLLNELKIVNIHRLPILWISFATLFYYSGNLFLFLAGNYLQQVPESYKLMWILHNILNFAKNILLAVALWQSYRMMKSLA